MDRLWEISGRGRRWDVDGVGVHDEHRDEGEEVVVPPLKYR